MARQALAFATFEARCSRSARELEERSFRYISSVQDHDLAMPTAWPFVMRAVTGRFPWEAEACR